MDKKYDTNLLHFTLLLIDMFEFVAKYILLKSFEAGEYSL